MHRDCVRSWRPSGPLARMLSVAAVTAVLCVTGFASGQTGHSRNELDLEAQASQWKTVRDNWYSLTLAGVHAGWMRVVREDDGERFRTVTEMNLRFDRAGANLDLDSYVEWIETHDGEPLKLSTARKNKEKLTNSDIGNYSMWEKTRDGDPLGLLISKREWEFDGDEVTRIEERSGEIFRSTLPAPDGPWHTPAAAERFISQHINDEVGDIEYATLDPSERLRHVTVRSQFIGTDEFPLDGELVPVTVWRTRTSVGPSQTISHYASDGLMMYSTVNLGIGVLETRLCSREQAQATEKPDSAAHAELPVVRPDKAVTARTMAVYEMRLTEGDLPMLPTAGAQTVTRSNDGDTPTITVDASATSAATSAELEDAQFRERAPVLDSNEALMHELGAQSLRETQGLGNRELAVASHAVVHRHFASQSVARPAEHRGGAALRPSSNSAEQAQLLSDVLRVHRIPSRIVSGLAYAEAPHGDNAFVWRQWVQALVDGRWLDLDPVTSEPFDAGHILTGVGGMGTAIADPDPLGFASLLDKVEIRVLSQE